MNETKIETFQKSLNPCVGCEHGCVYCYARRESRRNALRQAASWLKRHDIQYKHLDEAARLRAFRNTPVWCERCYTFTPHPHLERLKNITPRQKPKTIFIDSMWDWNSPGISLLWIDEIIDKMWECPQHIFFILSKNPRGYGRYIYPSNVWLGTSVTGPDDVIRARHLAEIVPKGRRFVSVEPLHGDVLSTDRHWVAYQDWLILGAETSSHGPVPIPDKLIVEKLIKTCLHEKVPLFIKDNVRWPSEVKEFPRGIDCD